jgi:zinc transport system permease protein
MFELSFMRMAALGGSAAAVALSVLGVYIVLRRVVFVGLAVANAATLGAAVALTAGLPPEVVVIGAAVAAALSLALRATPRRVPAESLVGWGYATAAALTVLVLARSAVDTLQVMGLVFGMVLAVTRVEALMLVAIAAAIVAIHIMIGQRLILVLFDTDAARAAGVRTGAWTMFLYLLVGIAVSTGLRTTGTLLSFAFLTLPAMAALLLTQSLAAAFALSAGIGVTAMLSGLVMSFRWDLPTGPVTVALLAGAVGIAQIVSRFRASEPDGGEVSGDRAARGGEVHETTEIVGRGQR